MGRAVRGKPSPKRLDRSDGTCYLVSKFLITICIKRILGDSNGVGRYGKILRLSRSKHRRLKCLVFFNRDGRFDSFYQERSNVPKPLEL